MISDSIPLSTACRIDEACDAFEAAWPTAGRIPLEDCLNSVPPAEQHLWLLPLLLLEIELRRKAGERPTAVDYAQRFPHLNDVVQEAFAAEATPADGSGQSTWIDRARRPVIPPPEIPGCQLIREAGRGGMGVVYEGYQPVLQRRVAVKFLRGLQTASAEEGNRFLAEAQALARLSHSGIVTIFEIGEVATGPYMIMEFLEGGSLSSRLRAQPLLPRTAAELLLTISRAVAFAHRNGILHRDLNPSNILLTADRQPRVSDFGLARRLAGSSAASLSGQVVGTPSYMAPEQVTHPELVGPATDIYGLGAILYEMLTGQPPFRGATALQTLERLQNEEPVSPSVLQQDLPVDLETLCLKCLRKVPSERYASADLLAEDLERFLSGRPVLARRPGVLERSSRWARRNPALAAALCGLVLSLTGGMLVSTWQWLRADAKAIAEERQRVLATGAFHRARELADYLTELSSRDLADIPSARAVRRQLLETALKHYEQEDARQRTEVAIPADIALTKLRLGDLQQALGQQTLAIESWRSAIHLLRQQLDPTDGPAPVAEVADRSRRHLAGALQNLGGALRDYGPAGQQEALQALEEAHVLWTSLSSGSDTDAATVLAAARCQLSLGVLVNEVSDPGRAAECYAEVIRRLSGPPFPPPHAALDGSATEDPPDSMDSSGLDARALDPFAVRLTLARAYSLLGNLREADQNFVAARIEHVAAVGACRSVLAAESGNVPALNELALCLNNLAIVERRLDHLPEARAAYEEAISVLKSLRAADPDHTPLIADLSRTLLNLGILEQNDENWSAAEQWFVEAVALHELLLSREPGNPDHRSKLTARWSRVAAVRIELAQFDAAADAIHRQSALNPDDPVAQWLVAREYATCLTELRRAMPNAAGSTLVDERLRTSLFDTIRRVLDLSTSQDRRAFDVLDPAFDGIRSDVEFQSLCLPLMPAPDTTISESPAASAPPTVCPP